MADYSRYRTETLKKMRDAAWEKYCADNQYLAEVNGVKCTAIFNIFTGAYYVDDVYGIIEG